MYICIVKSMRYNYFWLPRIYGKYATLLIHGKWLCHNVTGISSGSEAVVESFIFNSRSFKVYFYKVYKCIEARKTNTMLYYMKH